MSPKTVSEILSWYGSDNAGTLTNLARLLNHDALSGTGKRVILPVDQGFEHGPGRSFAMNPAAYESFAGRRIVIFSGGAADTDQAVFDQVRAIRDGGGFGSIIGRNSFQRQRGDAVNSSRPSSASTREQCSKRARPLPTSA